MEHAGGRSVRIPYNATDEILSKLIPNLNGILFPGGAADLPQSARTAFKLAEQINDNDDDNVFPVWGTCLGFEWINMLVSNDDNILDDFDAENISLALNFSDDFDVSSSRMFKDDLVRKIASTEPVTMNNHHQGVTPEAFNANDNLHSQFNLLSTNVDVNGKEFVSSIEAKDKPYFATQWHPEKNNFEFGVQTNGQPYEAINHSSNAIRVSQEMSRVFVDIARTSKNVYTDTDDFPLIFLDDCELLNGKSFEQSYLWTS